MTLFSMSEISTRVVLIGLLVTVCFGGSADYSNFASWHG